MNNWLKKYNIGFWLLSLVLAVMFWMYVSIAQNDETVITIKVTPVFLGEEVLLNERELKVTGGLDTDMQLRLRGRRSDLALCNEDTVKVIVDLNVINSPGVHPISLFKYELPDRVSVVWQSKTFFSITVDKIETVPFDIQVDRANVSVPEGYMLEDVLLEPDQIKVRGPSEKLKQIAEVCVIPVREELDRTVSFTAEVVLLDDAGDRIVLDELICEPAEVNVTLVVTRVKDVELQVDLIDGGGAQERHVRLSIEPKTIRLSGDPAVLDGLNFITLGSIDLANVIDGETRTFDIQLPNDTTSEAKLEAGVTINLVGLVTKRLETEDITIIGGSPPEGFVINLITERLTLNLRGPQAAMDGITDATIIRVVADLTDFEPAQGQQTVPVRASVDGFPEIGAVGEPKVVIEMVEITSS